MMIKYYSKFLLFIFTIALLFGLTSSAIANDNWGGVDESVVEKYAEEYGRKAWVPFINTDQGDLLLFVFLLAGIVGGFTAGYSWRILTTEHAKKTQVLVSKIKNNV